MDRCPLTVFSRLRCFAGINELLKETETSLKRIMPQNAHVTMAQIQASNGSSRINVARRACNMFKVMGGRMGRLWDPCKFLSPCSDQSMQLWSSPDSGGGQP
jgi:hypothetical protein